MLKPGSTYPRTHFSIFPKTNKQKSVKMKKLGARFSKVDSRTMTSKTLIYRDSKLIFSKKIQKYTLRNTLSNKSVNSANKLRYLQANKFDIKKTAASLDEYSKWRSKTQFPLKMTQQRKELIQSGAFYFCGRDHFYRPIIVIDIGRFDKNKKELIPESLVQVMEFMLDELLIQGQVQNYVMIMDLQQYSIGLQGIVSEILSFTSNSYRGRLFCNYILEMPTVLSWGWEAFASKFVSQNTLRKIKISKGKSQPSMWEHIDKTVIQAKFGGTRENIKSFNWPPKKQMMTYQPYTPSLISQQAYNKMYQAGNLNNRKVHIDLVKIAQRIQIIKPEQIIVGDVKSQLSEAKDKSISRPQIFNSEHAQIPEVKKQKVFNFKCGKLKTFFDTPAYEKIGRKD